VVLVDKLFLPFATHHRFICFMLYIFGKLHACHERWPSSILTHDRIRCLCWIFTERSLQVSVHSVWLDSYCLVPDRRASPLCHQQYLRGHDLVLAA
jgi:hypothetical protein